MTTKERWVDVNEVASHLGVVKETVYRWVEGNGLPAHRVGRLLRFKLSEVDAWVRRGEASVSNATTSDELFESKGVRITKKGRNKNGR